MSENLANRALALLTGNKLVPVKKTTLTKFQPRSVVQSSSGGLQISFAPVLIEVDGEKFKADPRELMRIVKTITQTIGEYKRQGNMQSKYTIPALRKARSQVVADLETHFRITWRTNEENGKSEFMQL